MWGFFSSWVILQDASVAVRKKALRLVPVLASLGPLNKTLMEAVFQRFADTEDSIKVS